MMGKSFIIGMSALLLLGSCDTYTGKIGRAHV